jgi:hypothetical protein
MYARMFLVLQEVEVGRNVLDKTPKTQETNTKYTNSIAQTRMFLHSK